MFRWVHEYDGTIESLKSKQRSGRPAALTHQQINKIITTPIHEANQSSKPIHYSNLIPAVKYG